MTINRAMDITRSNGYHNVYYYCAISFIFGLLNIVGTANSIIALLTTLLEYSIVFWCIFNKKDYKAFLYYLLFSAITIEMEGFIYGDSRETISYNFFQVPGFNSYIYILIQFYLFFSIYSKTKNRIKGKGDVQLFYKWLKVLLITGIISITIGMLFNDNNISNSSLYPKMPIIFTLGHVVRLMLVYIVIVMTLDERKKQLLIDISKGLIAGVGLSAIVGVFLGFNGWYGDDEIILSSLSICFVPFALVFCNKKSNSPIWLFLLTALFIITLSFQWPVAIGSKWYIVLFLAVFAWVIYTKEIKSSFWLMIVFFIAIALLVFLSPILLPLLDIETMMGHKVFQLLAMFNFSEAGGAGDWFADMSNSPLYRFDEVANTFIEYLNKPWYSIFGKGFGGTTLHHTNLLSWETDAGAFTTEQIKLGAYYALHESVAIIFLRHGIIGIVFWVTFMIKLIRRLPYTPWAIIGLMWFLFYWAYGSSLILGPIAIVLALSENEDLTQNINITKKQTQII